MARTPAPRKLAVGIAGGVTVAAGVVLMPLPGPGTLIVLAGLSLLGREFPSARRLLDRTTEELRSIPGRLSARRRPPERP